ncbi:histidine ammonia-lyase [Streptomyces sp. V4I8]|uniref:aromatic amino acid lyase n=1 Tax=Streptomyces sp. V4I8 TaxID=3156469 RepID=UPI00351843F2
MMTYNLSGNNLTATQLASLASSRSTLVKADESALRRVATSRQELDRLLAQGRTIYGVNTSMGGFVHYLVPVEQANAVQQNLINAVATNVGTPFSPSEVRAIMIARLNSLARGNSAITLQNFLTYQAIINSEVVPYVPSKGSLGASGDLGPLAAIALVATGHGRAMVDGEVMSGAEALHQAGIEPMALDYKEGLALINGTSAMCALGALVVEEASILLRSYEAVTCLTFETLGAKRHALDPVVHRLKPHPDQTAVAERLFGSLDGSRLLQDEHEVSAYLAGHRGKEASAMDRAIEDAYSLRCTPQILGPVWEALRQATDVVERELNSSNDNPLIVGEPGEVFHNGHFHGQYISTAMDHVAIALTTLTNLADRRIDRFLDASSNGLLPAFLCVETPGIRLGFMGGQFLSASLTAENRSLCIPVSVQTLTSTGDFQDIVSLGLIAARRAQEILTNAFHVVAFELLCGCQAADIRGADGLGPVSRTLYDRVRRDIPYLDHDHEMTGYIEATAELLKSACFDTLTTAALAG